MFGFFRRQKKNADNKKLKNKTILQCVPVDKYEIDFSKTRPQILEKPLKAKIPQSISIMGNTESTKKSNDTGVKITPSVYEKSETHPSIWSHDHKDERNKNNYSSPNTSWKENEPYLSDTKEKNDSSSDAKCNNCEAKSCRESENIGLQLIDEQNQTNLQNGSKKIDDKTNDIGCSSSSAMTNQTECVESGREYSKQRRFAETNEDGFDTAPSSPTSEAIENADNGDHISRKSATLQEQLGNQNGDVQIKKDDTKTDENGKKTNCEDTTRVELNEGSEETENHELRLPQVDKKQNTLLDIKQEIEKLPRHVEDFLNLKKCAKKIPDITITESSDSENDNESGSEEETVFYPNSYDRAYPTILYDISEVDEPFSDASDMEFNSFAEDDKRNIVHQESKFQDQIKTLKCELETKDTENMQLRGKINDLQREIMNKTWGMDRLHAELASFQTEADCVRKKLLKVEEDLNKYKTKNSELNEELLKKLEYENDFKKVSTLQNEIDILKMKITELQTELENVKQEKQQLQAKLAEIENEKNEKIDTLQLALDDTLKQKQKMQAQFEEEYEKLRTVNSDREQQLLNDFEWKLREVELTCKKKLEDKEKSNEEKIKQIRKQLENEINILKNQIKELEKMKTFEAEVIQLRGLTQEQQRSLRMTTRAAEQLQTNERILNEEIERLRGSLEKERSHLATVQGIHSREIAEKDRKHSFKLEQQKNEINTEWEDKFRRETIRLKLEMEKAHKEDKRNSVEETKTKAEKQLKENTQQWEKKFLDSRKQLEELEKKLTSKEESYRKELLRLQTNSDRDMLELRRKLDKMDLSYQEQLEKKQEQHEQEMEILRENCEKKIQQSEQNWSQQVSSTRATLELVKEQLQREAEDQLEALSKKYMLQLEQQYERLIKEKEDAIVEVQQKYSTEMYDLQNQLHEELKDQKSKEDELLTKINMLEEHLDHKNKNYSELQQNVDSLHITISELQEKISMYDNLSKEADALLRKKEIEHNEAIAEMKEQYENEIKHWQSKFLSTKDTANKEKTSENNRTEEFNASNIDRHSRSSRRKGRGRNRGQKNHHQLNNQFSSSL